MSGIARLTAAPTLIFKQWDIVKVPFPYTNRPIRQRRPALVIAAEDLQQVSKLLWVLMITSAENRGWPGDVEIPDDAVTGLSAASLIRTAKIATIEAAEAEPLGKLPAKQRKIVAKHVTAQLNF